MQSRRKIMTNHQDRAWKTKKQQTTSDPCPCPCSCYAMLSLRCWREKSAKRGPERHRRWWMSKDLEGIWY